MQELFQNPLSREFIINLFISLACGLCIGIEREFRGKEAGISTQTTVIAAAMLFSFISRNVDGADPARIAAGVVTGIGFLGAGIILKSKFTNTVHNLTTAASIWYSAAVGIAIGFNFYMVAVLSTLFVVIINQLPNIRPKKGLFK